MSTYTVDTSAITCRPSRLNGGSGYGYYEVLKPNIAVVNGVTVLTLTAPGSGFTSVPTVTISGGGGSGATATAALGFPITAVTVTSPGEYTATPTVSAVNLGGSGASFLLGMELVDATVVSGGNSYQVGNILTLVGTYTVAPQITVDAESGGAITAFHISRAGSFSGIPSSPVSVTGGAGSGATFNVVAAIDVINVNTAGQDYDSNTTISITGGAGPGGGTATPTLGTTGRVKLLTIGDNGTGYSSAPTVTISGGGGTGATATAALAAADTPINIQVNFTSELPTSNYAIDCGHSLNALPAVVSYTNKQTTGFIMTLNPLSGETLTPGQVDLCIGYIY